MEGPCPAQPQGDHMLQHATTPQRGQSYSWGGTHTHTHAWGHNDTASPGPNKQLTQPETASGINGLLTNMYVCMCAHAFA